MPISSDIATLELGLHFGIGGCGCGQREWTSAVTDMVPGASLSSCAQEALSRLNIPLLDASYSCTNAEPGWACGCNGKAQALPKTRAENLMSSNRCKMMHSIKGLAEQLYNIEIQELWQMIRHDTLNILSSWRQTHCPAWRLGKLQSLKIAILGCRLSCCAARMREFVLLPVENGQICGPGVQQVPNLTALGQSPSG